MPQLRQRSPEWREARRSLITSTDIPIILGESPYKSEGQLAREKLGQVPEDPPNLAMAIGQAMEPVIAAEYERMTGQPLTRYKGIVIHPKIKWAAASPDCRRTGQRYLVELKDTRARRWASGDLPRDVEAQVQWQLGCTGFPEADVAALKWGTLELHHLNYDPDLFAGLVVIAEDFRARMAAGGPFSENAASIRSKWPQDDGTEMTADEELQRLVDQLIAVRRMGKADEQRIDQLETDIKNRMATATRLNGSGWRITWKRSKDAAEVNWRNIAEGFLGAMEPQLQEPILSLNTTVKAGSRRFLITEDKEPK